MSTDRDYEYLDNKLDGYVRLDDVSELKVNQHFRFTKNRYRQPGRSCSYSIVKKIDKDGNIWINGFRSAEYPDWKLDMESGLKQIRVYIKDPTIEHTGVCSECGDRVDKPYVKCYYCMVNNTKFTGLKKLPLVREQTKLSEEC